MQKKLIALAIASLVSAPVLAAKHMGPSGSTVTLYGTFDAGVRHVDNTNGDGDANTTMSSSGTYNSNRWGMKGSENLGNGLHANFNLEGTFNSGDGQIPTSSDVPAGFVPPGSVSGSAQLFSRKAIVGLSGNFGKLDLGRNYTTIFYTTGAYDPFHYKYTGIIPIAGLDGARRDSSITYTSNPMNGLVIRANMALGEVAGSNSSGRNTELGVSYGNGPISFGVAYGMDRVATSPDLDSKQWTVGGAYKMDPFEVMAGYDVDKTDAAGGGDTQRKVWWVGGKYKLSSANALSVAYYNDKREAATDGTKKLWIIGFVHNLSKRTELYADIDHTALDGSQILVGTGTNRQDSVLGISVGINHAF